MKRTITVLTALALALTGCNKALNDIQPDVNTDTGIQTNEIWYTSADAKLLEMNDAQICNAALVGNRYDGDHGTLIFDGPVTSINDNAFRGCANLESVTLPPVVREVGKNAFKGCTGMKFINFDSETSVARIDDTSFETGSRTYIRVPYKNFFQYKEQWKAASKNIMVGKGYQDIDQARWTEFLPESMPIGLLTVPAAHDAATYYASYSNPIAYWLKDQAYDYKTLWDKGTRLFDLRFGNIGAWGEVDHDSHFYHGSHRSDSMLNWINDDVTNHFPNVERLKNSFLILEAQGEFFWDESTKQDTFNYLMKCLIDKYGEDRFIPYNPGLTLGELKGKIIMLVTQKEYVDNYHDKNIPLNYRWTPGMSDPDWWKGYIEVFAQGKSTGKKYSIASENMYEVNDADEKAYWILEVLRKKPLPEILFLGFNAVDYLYQYSWSISSKLNRKIVEYLTDETPLEEFCRPLGMVYMDFIGKETYTDWGVTDYDFAGESLAKQLVLHNFKDYIFK